MLRYPKIPDASRAGNGRCLAFEKLDGTNLHWVWDRDFGWHAFGTRRDRFNLTPDGVRRFDEAHPGLEGCADLFLTALADGLDCIFRTPAYAGFQELTAFTELFGPGSFAGAHKVGEPKEVVLFDVLAESFGFIGPEQFVADFGHLRSARVVYRGRFTGQLTEDVRRGKFDVAEGVVVKGGAGGADLWMVKIKTNAYLARLKAAFGERWRDFWE